KLGERRQVRHLQHHHSLCGIVAQHQIEGEVAARWMYPQVSGSLTFAATTVLGRLGDVSKRGGGPRKTEVPKGPKGPVLSDVRGRARGVDNLSTVRMLRK